VASGNLPALDLEYDAKVPLGLADAAVIDNGAAAQHPALTAGRKRYLCYFLHRHLEFRLPEITSLAEALLGDRSNGESSIGSSSDSSGGTEALPAAPPAVVWERPFGNRVRCLPPAACAAAFAGIFLLLADACTPPSAAAVSPVAFSTFSTLLG
jgi:hypothetical protein